MGIKASDLPSRLNEDGEPEWETVAEESADVVVMDKVGDQFIGEYLGMETIAPENGEEFDRYVFRDNAGAPKALNKSYKLEHAMKEVNEGDLVRVTYVKDVGTKRNLNPMKDYRVEKAVRR